ncbi:MAG: 50S ribosomal protein L35 [Deltaproteobacteria bacterium RBG_13_58_19]|nr:MAG: 50S ribosomal protein L35 [Deltaproteobacteria bacterium RBG_13_58_19]
MPKIKTHRGAAKRFKRTASGRLKCKRPGHSHLLTGKSRKRKRQQRLPDYVHATETKSLTRLLPYL